MIKKLKIKFIVLAMSSLVALLTLIVAGMTYLNYNALVSEADSILDVLAQNKGRFEDFAEKPEMEIMLPPEMSPETPYESRYFSVYINNSGEVENVETSKIASVNTFAAVDYAQQAVDTGKTGGFIKQYRYSISTQQQNICITFLDCGRSLDDFYGFIYTSIFMSVLGCLLVFVVISVFSGKIIKPIAESYEKQKRFITDAGHELKTPLTIINANVDILELELEQEVGENNENFTDVLADIKGQTRRLATLTEDLVTLTRMEENNDAIVKIDFPLSEVVAEVADDFQGPFIQQNKELVCDIQPLITLKGNDKAIRQLISIVTENALKYSPAGSQVLLNLSKHGKAIRLTVVNETLMPIAAAEIEHVFDRFYRMDSSRNSETGGHGIGLSIAKAIVASHGGKINASINSSGQFEITAEFTA